jgi:hypothetical protein
MWVKIFNKVNRLGICMLKNMFYRSLLMGLFLCLSAFKTGTPPVVYITLQNQALSISAKEFYIAGVNDGRKDNNKIGNLQPFTNGSDKQAAAYDIDLKGGIAAVKNFMSYGLPVNKTLRPIVVKLKTLTVTEAPVSNRVVKGGINLIISFYLQRGEDAVYLVDYSTNTTYQRKPGPAQQIEPLLRSALNNSLVYLNSWMNAQAGTNIKLAKSVKLYFTDYTEPVEGDTIYYSVNRPLKWTDFTGKPPGNSKHVAEVFSGLGYDENVKVENSIVKVTLAIKVYAPKSACWVSTAIANSENLNHEQRHFDIAKLVGEHFKQLLRAERLPTDNYDGDINVIYFDALREFHDLQKKYDDETSHSNNKYQQQLWDIKKENELAALVKKNKAG